MRSQLLSPYRTRHDQKVPELVDIRTAKKILEDVVVLLKKHDIQILGTGISIGIHKFLGFMEVFDELFLPQLGPYQELLEGVHFFISNEWGEAMIDDKLARFVGNQMKRHMQEPRGLQNMTRFRIQDTLEKDAEDIMPLVDRFYETCLFLVAKDNAICIELFHQLMTLSSHSLGEQILLKGRLIHWWKSNFTTDQYPDIENEIALLRHERIFRRFAEEFKRMAEINTSESKEVEVVS